MFSVINMEVPWETSTYLHRIGRCGRFGSYGIAITLASEGKETQELQEVVHETSSGIYKLEKVVETNEYEIPDLWKLKVAKSHKGIFNIFETNWF